MLNAADISGYARGDGFNEHLWYDFPSMKNVVAELVTTMSLRDAANSETYSTNGEKVTAALDALIAREGTLASKHPGVGVAITEPVPLYLLQASGFDNRTPLEFTTAIEDGTDVAASVLQQTLALFRDKRVSLLVYNKQTTGAETEKLKAAAKDAAIPVVGVTETLPAGEDYLSWMGANLDAIEKALS